MLRPSRPMMRPFSSSDLSSTTDTVVSTAWLDATRCITAARMLRERRSASRRVSSSTCRIRRALSWRSSSSSSRIRICLACPALSPDTRSSSRSCRAFSVFSSSRTLSRLRLPVVERALALAQLLLLDLRASSPSPAAAPPGARSRCGARAAPPRARRAQPARARPRPAAGRRLPSPERGSRAPPARGWRAPPRPRYAGAARACTTATATPAATNAAITISISVSSHGAQGADSTFSSLSGPACGSETADDYGPSRALLSGRSQVVVRFMFR